MFAAYLVGFVDVCCLLPELRAEIDIAVKGLEAALDNALRELVHITGRDKVGRIMVKDKLFEFGESVVPVDVYELYAAVVFVLEKL